MTPASKFGKPSHKESDDSETPSNNLWVGNLSSAVTDSDLMDIFASYGALDSVTTYSSRSYGFVFFKRVEDAKAAKEALQGTTVRGNQIKIEFARPAKPSKQVWVGGITPQVTKEELEEELLKFGKIEDFKFVRERNTALVEYVKLEDASQAVRNMNGKRIGGEQIRVDFLRSQCSRKEPDFRDSREGQASAAHYGARRGQLIQPSIGRKEGQPSKVLWIGYPPSAQIDEQRLHNAMILFGEIERIKSFPSRNYSFVEFRSVDEARRAKEGLQGRLFNDQRITIMYSSSGLAPGKEYSFYPAVKGSMPEMFTEPPFGSLDMLDHPRPMGLNNFAGLLPPGNIHRANLPLWPFGPQGGFDPLISGSEFNDLAFRDGSSNIQMGVSAPGIRPSARASSGWDVLDPNQFERESKRLRIDQSSIDDDSVHLRKIDRGLTYGHSPVGGRPPIGGPLKRHHDEDSMWRGIIAKGGTPVCNARCVPVGNWMEFEIPDVINCSARTGLDMLTKHYADAVGFEIVYFLPDSEEDFASYTEFLLYLGSKDRAGVAKFDDGTNLFLVPPSEFLTKVLKVAGPERLYGVVLKFPQTQLRQTIPFSHYVDSQNPPAEPDYNTSRKRDEHRPPVDYNMVLQEESKVLPKPYYPETLESGAVPSAPQDYVANNNVAVSQAGVSLTPELIATLASFLPAKAQSPASESGLLALGSSTLRPSFASLAPDMGTSSQGWKLDNQVHGNASNMQLGNQFNSQVSVHSHYQPYPSVSNHLGNVVSGSTQVQDGSVSLTHQSPITSRPLTSYPVSSQSGQFALPSQVSQQYQLVVPHSTQKGYAVACGADVQGTYSPSVIQQPSNPVALSNQFQATNYPQTQSGLPNNQVQQLQTAISGAGQVTTEVEADKNQRYQSTLQFATNLLLQIQQQQQQKQTNNTAAQGSGNQQYWR